MAMANSWCKGRGGDWLVRGPVGQRGTVAVSKRDGSTTQAIITRQVWTDGSVALYAVEARGGGYMYRDSGSGYYTTPRRCKTGGNCSSFGTGRSCGAPDCDGY